MNDGEGRGPIFVTTIVCSVSALLGHGLIWISYAFEWQRHIPWQPVAGISLSLIGIAAFGGFYLASRRARIGIASSFLLTFLVALTYLLTIPEAGDISDNAQALLDDFRSVVLLIIGFYFGSDAAVNVAKVVRSTPGTAAVQTADRDLVSPTPPKAVS